MRTISTAGPLIQSPPRVIEHFRGQLAQHADAETGTCVICRRPRCAPFCDARAELAMAGELDWDPLRERARRNLWLETLKDQ